MTATHSTHRAFTLTEIRPSYVEIECCGCGFWVTRPSAEIAMRRFIDVHTCEGWWPSWM